MRLCTSQGTEMEEEPADEGLVAPVRRLATLLIDVRAVDADSDAEAHGPSRHAAPLRLGRYRDMCLRAHYDELSTECKAAVAFCVEINGAPDNSSPSNFPAMTNAP